MTASETLLSAFENFGWAPGAGAVRVSEAAVRSLIEEIRPISAGDVSCAMVGGEDGDFVNEFRGLEGLADAWSDWLATFETLEMVPEEIVRHGDHVLFLGAQVGRSALAGVEISSEAAALCTIRGERVVRVEFHLRHASALRAAGLDPASYKRQE